MTRMFLEHDLYVTTLGGNGRGAIRAPRHTAPEATSGWDGGQVGFQLGESPRVC